jgi:hypothetical protein
MNTTLPSNFAAERAYKMYGIADIHAWRQRLLKEVQAFGTGIPFTVVSMLSDVQELVAMGEAEKARQELNRVKHLITHTLMPMERMQPGDLGQ